MHIYASNMHFTCRNMHLTCRNMQQICTKYGNSQFYKDLLVQKPWSFASPRKGAKAAPLLPRTASQDAAKSLHDSNDVAAEIDANGEEEAREESRVR